jgi:hypothetical protein
VTYRLEPVTLAFEIDWYAAGTGEGATYWDKDPVLLRNDAFDQPCEGVCRLEAKLAPPSETTGMILRIIKENEGTAIVDEVYVVPATLPSGGGR